MKPGAESAHSGRAAQDLADQASRLTTTHHTGPRRVAAFTSAQPAVDDGSISRRSVAPFRGFGDEVCDGVGGVDIAGGSAEK